MRRLYLRDAAAGDVVDDVFVISNKQFAASSNGKYYIKAFISDRSGQFNARMWNATRDVFEAMPDSGFLKIRGRIENYQNNLQFIIEQLWQAKEGSFDIGELLPQTDKDILAMMARVRELLGTLKHPAIKALIDAYLADQTLMAGFARAPAAMTFHHAYLGGLLEHTLGTLESANRIVDLYPGLSRDLVLAGVFLHDIAKVWELCYDCAFGYTDAGHLVGHLVKSAMWVEHKAAEAERATGVHVPQPLIDVLQHIILAHHGELQYGAARVPSTPEAIFVHYVEDLDAKMMMSLSATRGEQNGEGNWTEYMKAFSGRLYRPDPTALSDEQSVAAPVREETPLSVSQSGQPAVKIILNNPLFEQSATRKR